MEFNTETQKKSYKKNYYDVEDGVINEKYNFAKMDENLVEFEDIMISPEILEQEVNKFDKMNEPQLKKNLLKGIYAYGFTTPSRIQSFAVPQIIKKRDILAQSQSGTGKTGAFVISALELMDENLKKPQIIILSPTHELAQQTFIVVSALSSFMDVKISMSIGGTDRQHNLQELNDGENSAQIIIGTPGRVLDIMNNTRHMHIFDELKLLIIDECDELLQGNFKMNLHEIYRHLNEKTNISLFSATLTSEIIDLSNKILKNPTKILIKKEHMTLDGITQTYVTVNNDNEKIDVLKDILETTNINQILVYANSKYKVNELQHVLNESGFYSIAIHGENTKLERLTILNNFKKGNYKCLISTDLLSRGIDIQQLSMVINFELPMKNNLSSYIHRIGRSGRFGKKGLSINLINKPQNNYKKKNYDNEISTQTLIMSTFDCDINILTNDLLNKID